MTSTASSYVLQTGNVGAQRLRIVNAAYGSGSNRLLEGVVRHGMRVADVGCGTGLISAVIADIVGPEGSVVGIDNAETSLALAREHSERGRRRIEWKLGDAYQTELAADSFDVVYCRLLMLHLVDPGHALTEMLRIAKPGGTIVVEDLATKLTITEPPNPVIQEIQDTIKAIAAKRGTDWDIGLKIPRMMIALGLNSVQVTSWQPVYLRGEEKQLAESTFLEAAPRMIQAGLLTDEKARQTGAAMREFTDREDTLVVLPSMIGTWGRKPV